MTDWLDTGEKLFLDATDMDCGELTIWLHDHARKLLDAAKLTDGYRRALGEEQDSYARLVDENEAEVARLREDRQRLCASLAALLKFNKELCEDVGVSVHYPSADKARRLLAEEETND